MVSTHPTIGFKEMRLWIVGNGFDLFHGLHTRYQDYKAYLCQKSSCTCQCKKCMKKADSLPREVCCDCCKRENVKSKCPVRKFYDLPRGEMKEDLWRDLEESCSIDLDALLLGLKEWIKIRGDSKKSGAEALACGDSDFAALFMGSSLYDWFKDVETRELFKKGPNDQVLDIDVEKDVFLTFNYTSTLQKIYKPKGQLLHIHGQLKDADSACEKVVEGGPPFKSGRAIHSCLAFGSPDMTKGALNAAIKRFRKSQEMRIDEVRKLRRCLTELIKLLNKDVEGRVKSVKKFIRENCRDAFGLDEVVVAGHSLGRIDAPYFDFLADYFCDVKWRFLFYSESDLKTAFEFCKNYKLNGYYMPWDMARKSCDQN